MTGNSYVGETLPFGERAAIGPYAYSYRHRDRPTFTLCQRCGRNICPECQTSSAVGVLCPECMRLAAPSASVRTARFANRTGRVLTDAASPVVTYALMIACGIVFVGQL